MLAGVLLGPSMAAGQDEAATGSGSGPDPVVDPILHGPFQWHEAFRVDLRPRSPMTPRTLRIQPAAPLFGSPSRNFILIGEYRYDDLEAQRELDGGPLHRGELGGIYNRRLAPDLALNVDARVVYAVDADGHHPSAWYPNLRAGVTWSPSPEVAVSGAIFWSRTMLGLIPVPLLGVYYLAPDERFRFDVLAPRYVEAGFRPLPTLEVFAMGHWETLVWSVRDRASNEGRDLLVRQEVRAQAGLRVFLFGPVGLEVSAQWIPLGGRPG